MLSSSGFLRSSTTYPSKFIRTKAHAINVSVTCFCSWKDSKIVEVLGIQDSSVTLYIEYVMHRLYDAGVFISRFASCGWLRGLYRGITRFAQCVAGICDCTYHTQIVRKITKTI